MKIAGMEFSEVILADFEFTATPGNRAHPVCLVAWELVSGRRLKIWQDELCAMRKAPYDVKAGSLFVAYYASAEMSCHLALNWPMPHCVLDLFAEFRCLTNGLYTPCGSGLLGALEYCGISGIEAIEKKSMRDLILRGAPWTEDERAAILDYCESDVAALSKLLPCMTPKIDMSRALLRGCYMKAAAHIEHNGVPIDTNSLAMLRDNWNVIQDKLIGRIDRDYKVYEGRTFKRDRFKAWLSRNDIAWPHLDSGELDLKDDTFRQMARIYPAVAPLRELRVSLSQMRLADIAVGDDGRNRCLLSAFRSSTGRNQPSNAHFIFGPSVWLRGLIRPEPGYGLAYIDWEQQEFGIAAALSGDSAMQEAYCSGDPYLAFAKQAGAVPPDATKESHKLKRDLFKACALAVQYGMGEASLATRIGQPQIMARELLKLHRETYKRFWQWSDGAVEYAILNGELWCSFGWPVHIDRDPNVRFLQNFLMQGNGAEMLRIACCRAIESGIRICAPVHDAILIEAPLESLDESIRRAQHAMSVASSKVLKGFRLRTEVEVIRYPDRYMDERGERMWEVVWEILKHVPKLTLQSVKNDPLRVPAWYTRTILYICLIYISYYSIY